MEKRDPQAFGDHHYGDEERGSQRCPPRTRPTPLGLLSELIDRGSAQPAKECLDNASL